MLEESYDCSNVRISFICWSREIKVVGCENEGTIKLLVEAVKRLDELWPGARLEVIPQSDLLLRPIVVV